MKKLYKPIDLETGYVLNSEKSYFSVILPEEGKNLIYNCEMYDIFNYASDVTFTLNDKTDYGINSIDVSMSANNILTYSIDEPITNDVYTFSCYVIGKGKLELYIVDDLGFPIGGTTFVETYEFINRITHTFSNSASANPRIVLRSMIQGTYNFSGFQLEKKAYATTFISGNQKGFIPGQTPLPYYWVGLPHRSASIRTKETRSGGKILNFKDLDFEVLSYEGMGLPEFDNLSKQIAQRYGSLYQQPSIEEREITINGQITSCSIRDFFCSKGEFSHSLSPLLLKFHQPVKFLFQLFDCLTPISKCYEFYGIYNNGFEDIVETNYGQKISLSIVCKDPFFYDCEIKGKNICLFTEINSVNIIGKTEDGNFSNLNNGTLLKAQIRKMTIGSDNRLYAIGDKPGQGVVIERWNGEIWEVIGQSIDFGGNGYAIETAYNNTIYVGGQFNGINTADNGYFGNFPPVMNLAKYDIANNFWHWIGNVSGTVHTIEQLQNGKIAIGGRFSSVTDVNGLTTLCQNVIIYDPINNNYAPLNGAGSGIGNTADTIYTIKQTPDKKIWYGGNFTITVSSLIVNNIVHSIEFPANTHILQYNQSLERRQFRTTYITVGADTVYDLEYDNNGTLFAGGYFDATTAVNAFESTVPLPNHAINIPFSIAKLENGYWASIGMLATLPPASNALIGNALVVDLDKDNNGNIYIAGRFNYAGNAIYDAIPITTNNINPMDFLNQYNTNTFALTCYNGSKFLNNLILASSASNPFVNAIKSGGYYNSYNFTSTYANLPSYNTINQSSIPNNQNSLFIASSINNFKVSCVEIIDKTCSEISYPTFVFTGPGKLLSINNLTTGAIINIDKTLLEGELLTVDLTSPIPLVFSNFFGYQNGIILGGSFVSNFILFNGINNISILFDSSTINGNTKAKIFWKNSYTSIEQALCCEK